MNLCDLYVTCSLTDYSQFHVWFCSVAVVNIASLFDLLIERRFFFESQVHQNLLASQQSVLIAKKKLDSVRKDPALLEQFNTLSNLHTETLNRIKIRHSAVKSRLALWDEHSSLQSQLLAWIKEAERDRSRLQLRYIQLRRVPQLLQKVEVGITAHSRF